MTLRFIDENGVEKTPKDFGLAVLPNHEHEAIPETIDRTLSIPERDGLLYYGSNLGARNFNISMIVIPQDNKAQLQARIREFASYMLNGYGKPKKVKLVFDYEPDKFYYVRFSGRVLPDRLYLMAEFDLPLIADDPYAYASAQVYDPIVPQSYDTELQYDNDLMYPNGAVFQWTYNKHYSGVYNYSSFNSGLNLTIEDEVINPRIVNLTTGKSMTINIHLKQGERLKINSEKFSVKHQRNGSSKDIFTKVIGDFVELMEGKNELVFIGGSPNAKVNYEWKHKFV
jgi:predicted phage tail component-like protein